MYLKVDDGKAIFATHLIRCQATEELKGKLPLQVEAEGVICYSDKEFAYAEAELKKINVPYAVEQLTHDLAHVTKAQGIKYASRSEAVKHLLEDIEPESTLIPNLRKRLAEKEAEVSNLKAEMEKLKALVEQIKGKIMPPK